MLCEPPGESPMDGLVEELLRLESAKHKALVEIDAPAYDANVRAQLRLVSASKKTLDKVANVERLLVVFDGEPPRAVCSVEQYCECRRSRLHATETPDGSRRFR